MLIDKETFDELNRRNEELITEQQIKMFFEKKKVLKCETCGYELNRDEIGEHTRKNFHYNYKLKGTNLRLGILGK